MTTLNDAFKWALVSEDIGYKSGSKSMNVPTPLHQEPWLFHISMQENLSYGPATPRTHPSPSYPNAVCCWFTYEEDNTFKLTLENNSSEDDVLACCLPSITEEDDDMEEHFPTVSLDDNFCMEEPVPERHLCLHENSQHDLCPYPCPYDWNQLHLTWEDAMQYIDLNDIFDFPDVMVSANDDDVPSLEDILRSWRRCRQ